jgi:ABC-2 type transport system permease protein
VSPAALVWHQFRFDQKVFWRNPAAVFFTVMFPVIFLVLLATIFGGHTLDQYGGIEVDTYYVPAILTLALVSATMVNLAMSLTIARETGLLKRGRGTPLPAWVFIAGRVGNAIVVSLLMTCVVTAIGGIVFGVDIPWSRALEALATVAVGATAFCAIGVALTALIPSQDAAPPITNLVAFPLYFVSGVFIPEHEIPGGILSVASVLPVRPLFECFLDVWVPVAHGPGFGWGHLAVVAAWGVGAMVIAIRSFGWVPKSPS